MVIDHLIERQSEPLFSNRDQQDRHSSSIDPLLNVLERQFKLSVPDAMLCELIQDMKQKCCSKEITHTLIKGRHQRTESIHPLFS